MSSREPPAVALLTAKEFAELPEYSCSFPTGTTVGKRWKCNRTAYVRPVVTEVLGLTFRIPWPEDWWLAEYVPDSDPKLIGIVWKRIVVRP